MGHLTGNLLLPLIIAGLYARFVRLPGERNVGSVFFWVSLLLLVATSLSSGT